MTRSRVSVVAVAVLILLAAPDSAHAYVDPGTGSYLLQIALGVLFGSLYAIKVGWHRIVEFIHRITGRRGGDPDDSSDTHQ